MSASKCARCELTVYPVEGLRCLDKLWHKGCFKCHECNMTLSLKNYKGFDKKPYCNAHCPQAKATTVADTPEIRRLAENTRIQSQAKYHEDFEKSKGKGFTAIADDPETLRLKNTSKIISNVAYHGELERKKQMEERRVGNGQEDNYNALTTNNNSSSTNHNNNISNDQSRLQQNGSSQGQDVDQFIHQQQQLQLQQQQQQQQQQQMQKQQQLHLQQQQQQQQLMKQHQQKIQHQQQMLRQQQIFQDRNSQPIANRQLSQNPDGLMQQQHLSKQQYMAQQYPVGQPQQQIIMRQQHQQQMMLQQQQQQHLRNSLDPNMMQRDRSMSKQSVPSNQIPAQMMKHQIQQTPQQPIKYMSINEPAVHQTSPMHHQVVTQPPPHMVNMAQIGGILADQRIPLSAINSTHSGHQMIQRYNQQPIAGSTNGMMIKQQPQQQYLGVQATRNMIHPGQIHPLNQQQSHPSQHQMRIPQANQINQQQQQQQSLVPRRVFRAMYDYTANDVDEVSFYESDLLVECVNVDKNWLIGKVVRTGQTGMLPANYVAEYTG